jgi:hypothetical protein
VGRPLLALPREGQRLVNVLLRPSLLDSRLSPVSRAANRRVDQMRHMAHNLYMLLPCHVCVRVGLDCCGIG